jgi:hypothetical protein
MGRLSGSIGHAVSLDYAMKNFPPNSINILSDTDVAIVKRDWDVDLATRIATQNIHIFGTQLEAIGGFSSGYTLHQQYKGKPSTTWLAFAPNLPTGGLSMLPQKEADLVITDEKLSRLYNLPIGYKLVRDTGWQIPEFIDENDLKYGVLEHIKPNSDQAVVLKGLSDYHDEFHDNGNPFLVHQRGSMRHIFWRDDHSRYFYEAIAKYLDYPQWIGRKRFVDILFVLPELLKRSMRKLRGKLFRVKNRVID